MTDLLLEPRLPNGAPPPSGEVARLLMIFDPMVPKFGGAVGFETLQRTLMDYRKCAVATADVEVVLGSLQRQRFLDEVEHPGPRFPAPKISGLPGMRPFEDQYAPGDPQPGERCFAATPLGRKAARLAATTHYPQPAGWMLGGQRAADQILLSIRPPWATHAVVIDATCCCLETECVRSAIDTACRDRLLERQRGDRDEYKLTLDGEGRAHEVLAELQAAWQAAVLAAQQAKAPSPSSPIVTLPAANLVSQVGFMRDPRLLAIVRRDIADLGQAAISGLHKPALLLCGSIMEAVLVDVLDRNPAVAQSFMKNGKGWPDDASLPVLISISEAIKVRVATTEKHILSKSAAGMVDCIKDHRDLVHPRAEVRDSMKVDAATVEGMVAMLKLVIRDLDQANASGALKAYEDGQTV
jgi:hypothetical protein